MTNMKKWNQMMDKKKLLREAGHLTRSSRLKDIVKNKMMNPVRKKKKTK